MGAASQIRRPGTDAYPDGLPIPALPLTPLPAGYGFEHLFVAGEEQSR